MALCSGPVPASAVLDRLGHLNEYASGLLPQGADREALLTEVARTDPGTQKAPTGIRRVIRANS